MRKRSGRASLELSVVHLSHFEMRCGYVPMLRQFGHFEMRRGYIWYFNVEITWTLWEELGWWRQFMVCFSISTCLNNKFIFSPLERHQVVSVQIKWLELQSLLLKLEAERLKNFSWARVNRICRESFYCTEVEIARLFLCCPIIIFFNWPPFVQYQNNERPTRTRGSFKWMISWRAALFGSSAFLISVPNRGHLKKSPCTKS